MVDTQTRLIKSPGRWSQSGRVFLHVMGCRLAATPTARRGSGVKINTVRWGRSTDRGKCCSVVLPTGSIPSWRSRSLANRPTVPGSAEVVIHKSAALSDPDAPVMGRYGVAGPSLERVPIRHPTPLCSVTHWRGENGPRERIVATGKVPQEGPGLVGTEQLNLCGNVVVEAWCWISVGAVVRRNRFDAAQSRALKALHRGRGGRRDVGEGGSSRPSLQMLGRDWGERPSCWRRQRSCRADWARWTHLGSRRGVLCSIGGPWLLVSWTSAVLGHSFGSLRPMTMRRQLVCLACRDSFSGCSYRKGHAAQCEVQGFAGHCGAAFVSASVCGVDSFVAAPIRRDLAWVCFCGPLTVFSARRAGTGGARLLIDPTGDLGQLGSFPIDKETTTSQNIPLINLVMDNRPNKIHQMLK